MRFTLPLAAAALLAGCGQSAPDAAADAPAGGEVTVELPPPLPAEPTPGFGTAEPAARAEALERAKAASAEDDRRRAAQSVPPSTPAVAAGATNLVSASPPIPAEGLAGYIRGAGFECDQVVATSRVSGAGPYKFDCATGGSYRGTMRNNHLYFRPWTGS